MLKELPFSFYSRLYVLHFGAVQSVSVLGIHWHAWMLHCARHWHAAIACATFIQAWYMLNNTEQHAQVLNPCFQPQYNACGATESNS